MYYHEDYFTGGAGMQLYHQSWLPEANTRGILVIVHGLGGHGGLYGNIINQLIPNDFGVYTLDLRGHGKSPGQRGFIHSWDEYGQDLQLFLELTQQQHQQLPIFLLGHSMGGLIAIALLLQYPQVAESLSGLITIAPALSKSKVSPFKIWLGKILSGIYPRFSLDTGLDFSLASRDPEVVKSYGKDKLRHTLGTARLASEFFKTQDWVKQHIDELKLPFLMILAGADKVIEPEGNRQIFQQLSCKSKELREYPDSYHDIQNDLNHQEVVTDLINWLENHLSTPFESANL